MLSVQKDNRSQYNQMQAEANISILSSPTIPSTYNGGSNFNATGNARDHGISKQSPTNFRPALTGMSQGVGMGYGSTPGY